MKQDSGYTLKSGKKLYWDYVYKDGVENGYEIYVGDLEIPVQSQPEPFIKDPSKSYKENAIARCKEMADESRVEPVIPFTMTETMYSDMQSNIDYLMLLTDADSATEEETE